MKYLAVIPARGGSKGIPKKNILNIAGKPLIAWTIEQALQCGHIERVHVSTDDPNIAEVARQYGADVPYLRPEELAHDSSPTEPALMYALKWYEQAGQKFDAIVLLQPTSPLRLPSTLAHAIRAFENSGGQSLLGVCEDHHFFWRNPFNPTALYDFQNRPRRQDIPLEERRYRENGSIYITSTTAFKQHVNRLCTPIHMYVMHEEEGWEIDSPADFVIVEALINLVKNR